MKFIFTIAIALIQAPIVWAGPMVLPSDTKPFWTERFSYQAVEEYQTKSDFLLGEESLWQMGFMKIYALCTSGGFFRWAEGVSITAELPYVFTG